MGKYCCMESPEMQCMCVRWGIATQKGIAILLAQRKGGYWVGN